MGKKEKSLIHSLVALPNLSPSLKWNLWVKLLKPQLGTCLKIYLTLFLSLRLLLTNTKKIKKPKGALVGQGHHDKTRVWEGSAPVPAQANRKQGIDPGPGHRGDLRAQDQSHFQGKVRENCLHRKDGEVDPGRVQDHNDVTNVPDLIQPEEADAHDPGRVLDRIDQGLM